jgi:sugar/nucleoside kinase (ribokinase family)
MSEMARYLAVNTQVNSGNRGYHFITRYPRADFVSLNEQELRMAFHDRHSGLEQIAKRAMEQLSAQHLAVTRGVNGVMSLDAQGESCNIPALSTKVLDRIGAGDAFLALAALALGTGLQPPVAMLIGAAAAALDVQIVCNREPVERGGLINYLKTLLK